MKSCCRSRRTLVGLGLVALVGVVTVAINSAAGPHDRRAIVERVQGVEGCEVEVELGVELMGLDVAAPLTAHFSARHVRCAPARASRALAEPEPEPLFSGTTDQSPIDADHVALLDDSYGALGP
ncbi:MAG: hypothetical protein KC468_05810 [Myxococcales bacterium]|nr:hypothetical protein [Myxococcales bacterium]